jgi:hypothetical protein
VPGDPDLDAARAGTPIGPVEAGGPEDLPDIAIDAGTRGARPATAVAGAGPGAGVSRCSPSPVC